MGPPEWIALAALIVTITVAAGGVVAKAGKDKDEILQKIAENKSELDGELGASRMAAYEEYKTLRSEMNEGSNKSYHAFGDSIAAIREKVVQVEFWTRDRFTEMNRSMMVSMDMRYGIIDERFEKVNERLRQLELSDAKDG